MSKHNILVYLLLAATPIIATITINININIIVTIIINNNITIIATIIINISSNININIIIIRRRVILYYNIIYQY